MARNLADIIPAVFTGPGGSFLTPEQIAQRQAVAQSLIGRATDTRPDAGGWASVLNKALMGGMAGYDLRAADKAETANADWAKAESEKLGSYLAGGTMPSAASTGVGQELAATSPSIDPSKISPDIKNGIAETASALGIDPVDLATAISYETAGTFDPVKSGPTTQWGQHRGLIQFGEPQAAEYGVDWNNPVGSQLGRNGAVANYLRKAGVEPGMGMMDIYSAINAGRVGRYGASDANNGGAPGTVADKVNQQMGGHRANALALFGGQNTPAAAAIEAVAPAPGYVDPMVSAPNSRAAMAPELTAPVNIAPSPAVAAQPPVTQTPRAPNQAIVQALGVMNDPRATPGLRNVANALLQREQGRIETAEKQALAEQQRQQEIARRQSIAGQTGINPMYAADDALWGEAAKNVFAAPSTVTVGNNVYDTRNPNQPLITAPQAPTTGMQDYQSYADFETKAGRAPLGPLEYEQALRRSGATSVNVGGGENRQVFDAVAASAETARSAVTGLNSLAEARRAVEGGIISGAGADTRLGLQRVGALLGVSDPQVIQNTETFRSAIAPQVAAMMKATVGSTQISNADREFAQQAAGGSISLNEGTIKRLLDIMERAGRVAVQSHMDRLNAVYPDGGGFDRERALFGVTMPQVQAAPDKPVSELTDEELEALANGN